MVRDVTMVADAFKALGDPIRWDIVQQMVGGIEVAASTLEDLLPVAKPTISYHVKILTQAGLIDVHKQGRNHSYSLRGDVLAEILAGLAALVPELRLVDASSETAVADSADREGIASVTELLTW
ncbi:ArsR/SmtB family transcription factor [Nocardia noduli]|uniref:ArsR/SmtB family transcription factor n=1 Tax=Nocardia noduli TaxID=2815722 RepID=UPI001C242ED6|nr:metalloregulator ArsR/SmtB family transcription factor [Nocardia noduli]